MPLVEVGTQTVAYQRMKPRWSLIEDLRSGSTGMRAKPHYLPKEPKEDIDNYKQRTARSFLAPIYTDNVDIISSKPFIKEVVVETSGFVDEFENFEADVDLEGSTLTEFAHEVFTTGIDYGLFHILVDAPILPEGITLAEERKLRTRPYFVNLLPSNILYWRHTREGGLLLLDELHVREEAIEIDPKTRKETTVDLIRVWTRQDVSLYRPSDKEGEKVYVLVPGSKVIHSFGIIPLITGYFNRVKLFEASPCLYKLAEINLEHYQVSSDKKNILRHASLGILFGTGFTAQQVKQGITIATHNAVLTTTPKNEASLEYVEYQGKAIEATFKELERLEAKAEVIAHSPMVSTPGKVTATRDRMHNARHEAPIKQWVRSLESGLVKCIQLAFSFRGKPSSASVDVYDDFVDKTEMIEGLKHLRELRKTPNGPDISLETLLRETKRHGVLSENVDIEEEMEAIQNERDELLTNLFEKTPEEETKEEIEEDTEETT